MAHISALSTEYLHVSVTASVELDTQTVEFAILSSGTVPDDTTVWHAAEWEGTVGTTRQSRILVGPSGTVAPSVGIHDVWIRVTDVTETPVREAGELVVS